MVKYGGGMIFYDLKWQVQQYLRLVVSDKPTSGSATQTLK